MAWEQKNAQFLRRGRLRCEALFLAESKEEAGAFQEFRLKGELRSEQFA